MADWLRIARRMMAAEAATPAARQAAMGSALERLLAERSRYVSAATGKLLDPESARYVDDINAAIDELSGGYDSAAEAARLAQRPYLETLTRGFAQPRQPDMSLDSPLFRRMYAADRAYEQLAKGRTPNLRNAGGDLARIAGQAIRDENAAARAARNTPFLERALTNDPDGLLRYAGPLAAIGTTAAGGGLAIQNALEEKRRMAAQAAADAQELAAARPARMASLAEQQRVLDGMTPPDAEVYIDPAADADLQRSLADSSYVSAEPPEPPEARSAYHGIGPMVRTPYDEEPLIDTQYDMESMHDMFDPVASQVLLEDAAQDVYESLQASGYGNPVRIRSAGAVEGMARQQGLPTFPGLMLSGDAVPRRTPGEAAMRRKFYSGGRAND